ncbi:MAG: O-antigen ligase domain-containing protein [Bacteroidales bacterium]|nr:O-antigen ligase domain-containing protein [Bacteroidales bacterium]
MENTNNIRKYSPWRQVMLSIAAVVSVLVLIVAGAMGNMIIPVAVALLPVLAYIIMITVEDLKYSYLLLFVVNFFIPFVGRYWLNAPIGIIMDGMIAYNILVLLCHVMSHSVIYSHIQMEPVIATGIWLFYCILEAFNPRTISAYVWFTHVRNMGLYMFIIIILVQTTFDDFKTVHKLLVVWSLLVLVAVGKALMQKYIGWDSAEKYFLYVMDGQRTHIIHSGIRYFSIFTDASNFGGNMGMAVVVFLIVGAYTKNTILRIFYFITAALALYGLLISGTRSALAVPFAGLAVFVAVCGNPRTAIPVFVIMISSLVFLKYTNIGQGNPVIRRARSVFDQNDESYLVRQRNQARLKELLEPLPFGNSLGMSAGRGKKFGDTSELADIPTDSWFVQLWVETGRVGLTLYMGIMIYLLVRGGMIIFFTIRNNEVKGISAAFLSGVTGLFVMSSNNEVFSQYPNSIIAYTCLGLVFLAPVFDAQVEKMKQKENKDNTLTIQPDEQPGSAGKA